MSAAVAATRTFQNLADAISREFADDGLTAVVGATALGLTFGAFAASGLGSTLLTLRVCKTPRRAPSGSQAPPPAWPGAG